MQRIRKDTRIEITAPRMARSQIRDRMIASLTSAVRLGPCFFRRLAWLARTASLLRRIALAGAFLTIQAGGPDTAHALQEQSAPECIVVSPIEPDAMQQAWRLQRQTVRAATGMDLLGMADAWRQRPLFAVRYESHAEGLRVSFEEIPDSVRTPATYPIRLALEAGALGIAERFDVALHGPSKTFDLPFPYRPRFVAVRPEAAWSMHARIDQPASGWVAQVRHASFPEARLAAAEALRALPPDPALIIGLRTALSEESSSRVRATIAGAIARLASGGAAERALAAAYEDPSAEVRKAVLASLDQAGTGEALVALAMRAAQSDPAPSVQAEAVRALARMRAPEALHVARSALITPSPNEIIRIAGLDALGILHAYVHAPASAKEAENGPAPDEAGQAPQDEALPEVPADVLTEGLQFAGEDWPILLRNAARRLFLRIRKYEPTATYGAPPGLDALRPCG